LKFAQLSSLSHALGFCLCVSENRGTQKYRFEVLVRGCLKSSANAKFTERGTGFMPALRKLK
jgi:hypothetical protein